MAVNHQLRRPEVAFIATTVINHESWYFAFTSRALKTLQIMEFRRYTHITDDNLAQSIKLTVYN